jgi:hypothetical protein
MYLQQVISKKNCKKLFLVGILSDTCEKSRIRILIVTKMSRTDRIFRKEFFYVVLAY